MPLLILDKSFTGGVVFKGDVICVGSVVFLAVERDSKANTIFLLEVTFFLCEAAVPKYTTRPYARLYILAIIVASVYYNCGRREVK